MEQNILKQGMAGWHPELHTAVFCCFSHLCLYSVKAEHALNLVYYIDVSHRFVGFGERGKDVKRHFALDAMDILLHASYTKDSWTLGMASFSKSRKKGLTALAHMGEMLCAPCAQNESRSINGNKVARKALHGIKCPAKCNNTQCLYGGAHILCQ